MFTVYHSNQLDILKELTAVLMQQQPLTDPFQPEMVLVQSPGMAQWLQIELAEKFHIAANIQFPLPGVFLWDMCRRLIPEIPKESAFSKEAMSWKLMHLLPQQLDDPAFALLAHYLEEDNDDRKLHQLAGRTADLFDQYLIYRPDWIMRWQQELWVDEAGDAQQWQAPLWRRLVEYTQSLGQLEWHHTILYQRFVQVLEQAESRPPGLPDRVFICGISALPPVYLQALNALGKHIDVHLLFTNPCRYYWGDIQDEASLARLKGRQWRLYQHRHMTAESRPLFRDPARAESLFKEDGEQNVGNPLLASWGKLGRDNLHLLEQLDETNGVSAYVDIEEQHLLSGLQRDILELEDSRIVVTGKNSDIALTEDDSVEQRRHKRPLTPGDRSVSVHACHSPQREVEVLHDQLLAMMADDPDLMPRDIIVMVADIDSYSPFIQAVFGNAPEDRYLPFSISDQRARHAHPALQAVLSLLELPTSRFMAEQVLALLEVPALASRFGIHEEGLRRLRLWVTESGIRWGLDDDNVRELMLPPTGQHTWRFGITRMLLGYAMDSHAGDWRGVLPYDESSGLIAELAGQLADLLMQLSQWRQRLQQPRTLEEWQPLCRQLVDDFFLPDGDAEAALTLIEEHWQQIINTGMLARYPQSVPVTLLRSELAGRLDRDRLSQRFLAGAVNFCTLMPMRSIPFKAVCLLGMNDGVYPRTLPPLGFDLMSRHRRRGDRSRREDDRYLFLEALLSAQNRLYISYIGHSIQDNSPRFPSVLVSELLDYIAQSYCVPGDEDLDGDVSAERLLAVLCCEHPRMPFDADNFIADGTPQSFAAEWLAAAGREGASQPPFDLPLPEQQYDEVTLDELKRFYRHPVRAFFQLRLGVNFVLDDQELREEEPFLVDHLDRYQMNTLLLNALINDGDADLLYRRMRAAGELPYGAFGELYWQTQLNEMRDLAARVREERQLDMLDNQELDITLDGVRVTGWLTQIQHDGLLRWRPGKISLVDGMMLWLEHLAYCLNGGEGDSRIYGREDSGWRFPALSEAQAREFMALMISGYQQGMNQPLLLLNRSGGAWLKAIYDRDSDSLLSDETTLNKAQQKLLEAWQGTFNLSGEGEDYYLQRIVREMDRERIAQVTVAAETWLLPAVRFNQF
ncbi:exonuclease V subunit gamma [Lonsdalea britannica]|uniref:exodeoxyribonuclease V subunit gamma n=1 Tax=Lonsdalea britannica TaxID=1082704 RepID=UPI000A1F2814|nr:exodeoxyribonuclease V subunit gamma [Lonsdalea britannica]OSN08155.1 exonuclease V subunit gamma [Lonsdalea britannica]